MFVPTSAEFINLIRKSGVVDEQVLSDYLRRREIDGGVPAGVLAFAEGLVRDGVLTNFQAEQFLEGKWRGFTIGKYKLLERIGVGGMGQVFLCEHMLLRKRVAVKVLPPAKAAEPAALGRFYREARAAGSLDHPNVIRTHDIDHDGNLHFIVMDYVAGPNLRDVVKRFGPLDIARAVSYANQVATGLDYAFRNKVIHRDVKPGNILIDRRGVARILDLGLARFINDHTDQLTIQYDDKIVLGTADYVAPEQVANSHAADTRADVYGLGATLYFLLAGQPPFPTGTVSQKMLWQRTKEPTPVRAIRPEVPEDLAAVVARMMAKDPKARYQTPAQAAVALAELLPESIPLPGSEEMPRLSPAAADCPDTDILVRPPIESSAAETARTAGAAATALMVAPEVATNPFAHPAPFGPGAGPWWEATGHAQPDPGHRPSPTPPSPSPSAGDASEARVTAGAWALIGGIALAALAAALIATRL